VTASANTLILTFTTPLESLYINNCRFLGGALPLQISGEYAFFPNNNKYFNGITISNSEFISTESGSTRFTLLDIDLELGVTLLQLQTETVIPKINIHHNIFSQKATDFSKQVLHSIATGSIYNSQAIIQIYAGLCDVNFSDNKIYGTLTNNTVDGKYFGLYVNNYDQAINTSLTGLITSFTKIYNNTFEILNEYENATTSDVVCSIGCTASIINIFNNYISMINTAYTILPPTSNVTGCLYINNKQTNTFLYNECLVSNNIFSRRRLTGGSLELKRAFIYIDTDSGPGRIYDNNFSDPTLDGTDTELLINNSSFIWFYERNKNQTKTTYLRGDSGVFSLNDRIYTDPTITSYLQILQNNPPNYSVRLNYTNPDAVKFVWSIPLYNILPKNTYIIEVSATAEANSVFNNAALTFRLHSNSTTPNEIIDTSFNFTAATGPFTSTLTPGNTDVTEIGVNSISLFPPSEMLTLLSIDKYVFEVSSI
jgi:Ni,Fe-hydrogenase III small subunit